jgi:hypothetical protein
MPGPRNDNKDHRRPFDVGTSEEDAGIVFEEYLLRRAALDRAENERRVAEAVSMALSSGLSWIRIGHLLGTSAEMAQQRYGGEVRRAS